MDLQIHFLNCIRSLLAISTIKSSQVIVHKRLILECNDTGQNNTTHKEYFARFSKNEVELLSDIKES